MSLDDYDDTNELPDDPDKLLKKVPPTLRMTDGSGFINTVTNNDQRVIVKLLVLNIKSQKKLNRLTIVLIFLTGVLAVLTAFLLLKTLKLI